MKNIRCLTIGILYVALASCLEAVPVPGLNLKDLTEASDLVVVGKVVSISEVGVGVIGEGTNRVACKLMTFDLLVDQTLKGFTISQKITVAFSMPSEFRGYRFPRGGDYGAYFLKNSDKQYALASPYHPSVMAVPGVRPEGNSVIGDVIAQMAAALQSTSKTTDEKVQIIEAFRSNGQDAATSALQAAARDGDPAVKYKAIGLLLARNDISHLAVAEEVLLGPDVGLARNNLRLQESIQSMAYGIGAGVKDVRAIPTLLKLQASDDPVLRLSCARALMNTGSPDAVRGLMSGLDDADVEVRYWSAEGLAKITKQPDRRPDLDVVRSGDESYLGYWREWAKARK